MTEETTRFPRTRAQCLDGPRPCPHVRCKFHLAELLPQRGPAPRRAPPEPIETCALDIAQRVARRGVPLDGPELARLIHASSAWGNMLIVASEAALRAAVAGTPLEEWRPVERPPQKARQPESQSIRPARRGPIAAASTSR